MPAPYSDNLYSADDNDYDDQITDDNDLDLHLSPTDGYFQNSTSSSAGDIYPPQQEHFHSQDDVIDATFPTSAGVPHVPNVLVQDPSLRLQQEGSPSTSKKDHEAREEARLNSPPVGSILSSAAPVDEDRYYDGSSTAADSEATPSHTTTATTTAYTYTFSNAAQSSSSYTPYAPSADAPLRTPQTHPRRSLYSHPASLFRIPREAPPAYTPSPTSPLASSPTQFRNYRTFSSNNMGASEEEARLLGRDPESMGDDSYDNDDPRPSPSWKDRVLKKFPWASRRTLKTALLVALVFFTLTGFLSMLATTVINVPSDKAPSTEPPKELDPVTGQPIKVGPSEPNEPNEPSQPGEPNSPMPWNPASTCLSSEYRFGPKVFGVSFNPDKTLSVIQAVETNAPSRGYRPQITGEFLVRRQQGSAPGPSIDLEVVANDERLDVGVEWDSEQQKLLIKTPQRIDWTLSLRPCLAVRATVWVPENAELSHLYLAATHLDVQLAGDLSVTVENGLEVVTIAGDVRTPAEPSGTYRLGSRDIAVKTISGDVTGSWPLYDSLKIHTESGDIHANVNPQPVLESKPRPAVLEVTSVSGTISVKEPLDQAAKSAKPDTVIPPRDYMTTLDAKSGGMRAWVAFTTIAVAQSISGDLAVELLPVFNVSLLQSTEKPELHTNTKSGNVAVKMLEPIWAEIASTEGTPKGGKPRAKPDEPVDIPTNPVPVPNIPKIPRMPGAPFIPGIGNPFKRSPLSTGRWADAWPVRRSTVDASTQTEERDIMANDQPPMRYLKSSHSTLSGNMEIRYPDSWEGSIMAESNSGKVNIRGKNVIIDSKMTWPRAVYAHKGQAFASDVSVSSIAGDQTIVIGAV